MDGFHSKGRRLDVFLRAQHLIPEVWHALLLLNLRAATFDLAMIGIYGRRSPS